MDEKRKRKLNIVDVVVIVLILAAAVFFAWKLMQDKKDGDAPGQPGIVRFVVEIDGLQKEVYEQAAAMLPAQMAASGKMVDGWILETWSEPVTVERILAKSPVNASREQELLPVEGTEYVNAYFVCENSIDLSDRLNLTGNQEIRLGRSYFLKTVDLELNGTIISLEKRAS